MFKSLTAIALALASLTLGARVASADDYIAVENIAPLSAQSMLLGLGRAGEEEELSPSKKILQQLLYDSVPFWRDSTASLKLRGYDFQRDNDVEILSDASAIGTELGFKSGQWHDRVSVVASWHTSSGFDAPSDLGGSGILAPDQSNLSMISRAYVHVDLPKDTFLRLYRQDFNVPYLNRSDSRMIPNTHEAYIIERDKGRLEFLLGHVTKMKKKDSEDFLPMGEVAGAPGNQSGSSIGGIRFNINDDISIGAMAMHTSDLFSTAYSETSYKHTFNDQWGMQLAAQATQQWSIGEQLLGDFNTHGFGLRGALSYQGAVLNLAYTKNNGDFKVRSPFGGRPNFTTGMLYDFDRAGEEAWRIGLSQNFEAYGLPGFSVIVNYTEGRNSVADNGIELNDESEMAITADYRPPGTALRGLWLRVRYADGRRGDPLSDRRNLRIIVNYSLSAL